MDEQKEENVEEEYPYRTLEKVNINTVHLMTVFRREFRNNYDYYVIIKITGDKIYCKPLKKIRCVERDDNDYVKVYYHANEFEGETSDIYKYINIYIVRSDKFTVNHSRKDLPDNAVIECTCGDTYENSTYKEHIGEIKHIQHEVVLRDIWVLKKAERDAEQAKRDAEEVLKKAERDAEQVKRDAENAEWDKRYAEGKKLFDKGEAKNDEKMMDDAVKILDLTDESNIQELSNNAYEKKYKQREGKKCTWQRLKFW